MSKEFDEFKIMFLSRMIGQLINSGNPPSKYWQVTEFFQKIPVIMESLMSVEGYKQYLNLSKEEQVLAINFVENCGPYIASIIDCPLYEEWDNEPIVVTDEKINELRQKYKLMI